MKKIFYLLLIAFIFSLTGCGSSNAGANITEISDIFKENLDIDPYIPETGYKLGAVILEHDLANLEPHYVTINYYDSSENLTEVDEETMTSFEESFPERKVVYGTLYIESPVISIEIYPTGEVGLHDVETIDILGHEVQYANYKKEEGRNMDYIFMAINFDHVNYVIQYNVQSDNIEDEAKKLAEDIIKNNL